MELRHMKKLLKNISDILSYTIGSISCLLIFILLLFFFKVGLLLSILWTVLIGSVFLFFKRKNKNGTSLQKATDEKLQRLTSEKEDFYLQQGLSKEEMIFFRETMNTAKNQIVLLEKNFIQVSKLKAIETRNDTIQLTKSLFKEIVEEPRRLHEVDQFLYVHLPSLVELTSKYIEINQHKVKNKATFDVLDKSATTIDQMCQLIATDYEHFMSNDLEDMDIELELAKQTLARDNEATNVTENEDSNESLKERL